MNTKGINRKVLALALSLCLEVIGHSALSAHADEPKQPAGQERRGIPVEVETKGTAPSADTANSLAKACEGKKTDDTVKIGSKVMSCPPRANVRDPGTPADIRDFEALVAACKGKKSDDTVNVSGQARKCPAGIDVGDERKAARLREGARPAKQTMVTCSASAKWAGWNRCCEYELTTNMGWQMRGCYMTQH